MPDPWALQRFDGTALYEHEDPKLGWHPDWGSYIFNFGRNEVKSFLISNAYYWLEEFHIDGLRVDGVASMLYLDYSREAGQWVPNKYGGNENLEAVELLQRTNSHAYARARQRHGRRGVHLLAGRHAEHRLRRPRLRVQMEHGLDERLAALHGARADLPAVPPPRDDLLDGVRLLGELHPADQPRRSGARQGSMFERAPQDEWRKFGTLRAFYAFMWAHPGKKLLFMGTEFGQRREFSESRSVDWWQSAEWGHRGLQRLIKDMNAIYREHPALWKRDTDPSGFSWIDADDRGGNVFSWLRYDGDGQMIACIINFSSEPPRPPDRAAHGGDLEGDLEHRRRGLRRHRLDRQPRTGGRSSSAVARLCGIRLRHDPPAWCGVAAAGTRAG